jgi:hypothetical protein
MTFNRMTLQYKWDVYLLTAWFKTPEYYMYSIRINFIEKYKVSLEDCAELIRFPKGYIFKAIRVQPWICAQLPGLSKVLWDKDLSDVFDMANELKTSTYGSQIKSNHCITNDERNDLHRTVNARIATNKFKKEQNVLYQSYNRNNQWLVTK